MLHYPRQGLQTKMSGALLGVRCSLISTVQEVNPSRMASGLCLTEARQRREPSFLLGSNLPEF